jgi:cyanophycin synthetase
MNTRDIVIQRTVFLRGPNMWTYRPVLEVWVDIASLTPLPKATASRCQALISEWLPILKMSSNIIENPAECLQELAGGNFQAALLEHVTTALQSMAGLTGGFGHTHSTSSPHVFKVIVRAWHEDVTMFALLAARELILAAINDQPYALDQTIETLNKLRLQFCLGPSTACIVDAADDRDIPAIRLSEGNLLQLGYGVNQRRIWTAETDNTSAIAETISRDKELTKSLLDACGIPVPHGREVTSAADAWLAAQDIGLPVVVKPTDGNHQRGVFTNLSSEQEIQTAYTEANKEGAGVLVENFIPGVEHRLLIVGGKLVAAARGENATVTGDGQSSIAALIEVQINEDPRRGHQDDLPLNRVNLSPAVELEIARQGLTFSAVPAAGQVVTIQRIGNVAYDCTELVHPEVAALASVAARVVGLDIAGIDLVVQDISQPLHAQGGAIVEVNAGPGLLMHLKPAGGRPRQVGRDIVDYTFAPGDMARVPVIGITGTRGKTMTGKLLFRLLSLHGLRTGLAGSEGLFVDNRQLRRGNCATWADGRRVLLNREVQAAIIENGCTQILTEGLAYERCEVGIITNIDWTEDLSNHDVLDEQERIKVYRTQMDVVLPSGMAVLNADDDRVIDLARFCDGQITFFSRQAKSLPLVEHLQAGGRAVFIDHNQLILAQGAHRVNLCDVASIPVTERATNSVQIYNVMAAAASAWALGLSPDLIEAGLIGFVSD